MEDPMVEAGPPRARHPRAEATALFPPGHEARVLEPSPPAVDQPPWFADDPVERGGTEQLVVSPVASGDLRWEAAVERWPHLEGYAREHWLVPRRLPDALPPSFLPVRAALHQVAYFALAPRRHAVTGKLGLRSTWRGFGTPFQGGDEQARVEGVLLVRQREGTAEWSPLSTVEAACRFLGVPYRESWFERFHDPLSPIGPDAPLHVDEAGSSILSDWFGFATLVLEELRAEAEPQDDPSRVQLWPEHFDVAVEVGGGRRRAAYGASPGDSSHPAPYLYVAPWERGPRPGRFWNAEGFPGAILGYEDLVGEPDQRQAALRFLREGRRLLAA